MLDANVQFRQSFISTQQDGSIKIVIVKECIQNLEQHICCELELQTLSCKVEDGARYLCCTTAS